MSTGLARGDANAAERVTCEELASSKAMVLDALIGCESLLDVSIARADPRRPRGTSARR